MNGDQKSLRLRMPDGDYHTAYLELADHPHELVGGFVKRTVQMHELIPDYEGPSLNVDFDDYGRAVGIEILYPYLYPYDDVDDPADA